MACSRCHADSPVGPNSKATGWCADCERLFDTWSRTYAGDIVVPVLAGTAVITTVAMVLPFLGVGLLVASTGVFAGFGTLIGLARWRRRQRRRQFLQAPLPRAYLPSKT